MSKKLATTLTLDIVDEAGEHFARYEAQNYLTQPQLLMLEKALADMLLGLGAAALGAKSAA